MNFYLGTHLPAWLERTDVPLFISRRTLSRLKRLPRARGAWALDSGSFTELSLHGQWTVSARDYVQEVRHYRKEIGGMDWCAQQDWMCEAEILRKTGHAVRDHQRLTLENYMELRDLAHGRS